MAKTITLKLQEPVTLHEKTISEIVLKEPTGAQYLDVGEPRLLARHNDGTLYWVEDQAAIKTYLDLCIVHDHGPAILRLLALTDSRRAKSAFLDFFSDGDQTTDGA